MSVCRDILDMKQAKSKVKLLAKPIRKVVVTNSLRTVHKKLVNKLSRSKLKRRSNARTAAKHKRLKLKWYRLLANRKASLLLHPKIYSAMRRMRAFLRWSRCVTQLHTNSVRKKKIVVSKTTLLAKQSHKLLANWNSTHTQKQQYQYFINRESALKCREARYLRGRKNKKLYPFTFAVVASTKRTTVQAAWASSAANLKSFEQFLESFRLSTARKATEAWKTAISKSFGQWNTSNVSFYKTPKLQSEDAMYKARIRLAWRLSKEEARIRTIQKKLRRWISTWPISTSAEKKAVLSSYKQTHHTALRATRKLSQYSKRTTRDNIIPGKAEIRSIVKKSIKCTKHLAPAAVNKYRIHRFLSGLIWQFISPEFKKNRKVIFKKYIRGRAASRAIASTYVAKMGWSQLATTKFSLKERRVYARKRKILLDFHKYSKCRSTRKLYRANSVRRRGCTRRRLRRGRRLAGAAAKKSRVLVARKKTARRMQKIKKRTKKLRVLIRKIRRRRVARRLYYSLQRRVKTLPTIYPTANAANRYDRTHQGKNFSKRKARKFLRMSHILQWTKNISKHNKKVSRRLSILHLQQTKTAPAHFVSSNQIAAASRSNLLPFLGLAPTDAFPFRHRRDLGRRILKIRRPSKFSYRLKKQVSTPLISGENKLFTLLLTSGYIDKKVFARQQTIKKTMQNFNRLSLHCKKRIKIRKLFRKLAFNKKKVRRGRLFFQKKRHKVSKRKSSQGQLRKRDGNLLRPRARYLRKKFRKQVRRRTWKNRQLRRSKRKWRNRRTTFTPTKQQQLRAKSHSRRIAAVQTLSNKQSNSQKPTPIVKRITVVSNLNRARSRRLSTIVTFALALRRRKRSNIKTILSQLPYYSANYRLRARLLSKARRALPTKTTAPRLKEANKTRLIKLYSIYHSRKIPSIKWNKMNRPFKQPVSIKYEEQFKRDLHNRWKDNAADAKIAARAGFPSHRGSRRKRRSFVTTFSKNRWWKPTAFPLPHFSAQTTQKWSASHRGQGSVILRRPRRLFQLKLLPLQSKFQRNSVKTTTETRYQLKNAYNWQAYTAWAVADKSLAPNSEKNMQGFDFGWSSKKVEDTLLRIESKSPALQKAWLRYSRQHSIEKAALVRQLFVFKSYRWLAELPLYKLVTKWSLGTWEKFQAFLSDKASATVQEFRTAYISKMYCEIFATQTDWWTKEVENRTSDLLLELQKGTLPKRLLKNLKVHSSSRLLLNNRAGYCWQERKLLVFSSLHLSNKEQRNHLLTAIAKDVNATTELKSMDYTSIYNAWIVGVENHLKQLQKGKSIPSADDTQDNTICYLGTEQPRFPARGRRKYTFDAFLRGRFGKLTPLRFRRVGGLRFRRFRPKMTTSFMFRSMKTESTSALRCSHRQLHNARFTPYPAKKVRALLLRMKKNTQLAVINTKRRFASLPMKLAVKIKNKLSSKLKTNSISYFSNAAVMMRRVLKRRFVARRIRDLRKDGRRRRLFSAPKEPFWKRFRLSRRKRLAVQHDQYSLSTVEQYRRTKVFSWAFSEFAVHVPGQMIKKINYLTPQGEILSPCEKPIRRLRLRKLKAYRLRLRMRKWKRVYKLVISKRGRFQRKLKLPGRIRRKKPSRWIARKKSSRHYRRKIRWQKYYFRSRRSLPRRTLRQKLGQLTRAKNRFNCKLVNQTRSSTVLTPLHFWKPTSQISVSAAEKKRWRLYIQASRQRRYRRLTELSEALTSYFPQLIRALMETQLKVGKLAPAAVSGLVQSIYWNLRVYLQHDFTGEKLEKRYALAKKRLRLKREITTDADQRAFSLLDLRKARFRFQPQRVHPAASFVRGTARWLRRFLPRFYELNLEDPEKYKHLTLSPIKILRSHLSCANVENWKTHKIPGRMEDRLTRLTTERNVNNAARFENMLMTTRRTPIFGGYGAAATLRVVNPAGAYTARTSFFSHRAFSTNSVLNRTDFSSLSLVSSRVSGLNRLATNETKAISDARNTITQYSIKARLASKTRARELRDWTDSAGSLDIRSARLKSPRNAEYLQRGKPLIKQIVTKLTPTNKNNLVYKTPALALRSARSSVYKKKVVQKCLHKAQSTILSVFRQEKAKRRIPALLFSRNIAIRENGRYSGFRRLFTSKIRARARTFRPTLSTIKAIKWRRPNTKISTKRSILHFRKAVARSKHTYFTAPTIVTARAIQLKEIVWNLLNRHNFKQRLVKKIKRLITKRGKLVIPTRRKLKRRGNKQNKTKRNRNKRNKLKHSKRVKLHVNKMLYNYEPSFLKRTKLHSHPFLFKSATSTIYKPKKKIKLARLRVNFFSHAKKVRGNSRALSKYVNAIEKRKSHIIFTQRRSRLWGQLTLRWMKKRRILKGWLKTVKYSFKQKSWVAAVKHTLRSAGGQVKSDALFSDTLFKASRLRLRRLEWREASDRFFRKGMRSAFTFYPSERRSAPWLESLIYKRSLYNFKRGNYKRDQFPREQKSKKWLQRLRKALYRKHPTNVYIKSRRWARLRTYNQRLHRSLFNIRNTKTALKRFRKLSRRKAKATGLEKLMTGFGDRLDVNLILLNIAPTTFWARVMAPMGLLRINGKIIRKAAFRLQPGDYIEWLWCKIKRVQTYFKSPLRRGDTTRVFKNTSIEVPGNFAYCSKLRSAQYLRLPRPADLTESSRLNIRYFRWFHLDSGLGK